MTLAIQIKKWRINNKDIILSYQDGRYKLQLNDGIDVSPIPLENVDGIPFDKLNDPDEVELFLKDTYVKLHTINSEKNQSKLYVLHGLSGGANIINPEKEPNKLWPNGIIPFEIDTETYPVGKDERVMIMTAIKAWNDSGTGFQLIPRTDQKDYLVFGENDKECNSYVGRAGGRQYIRCDLDGGGFNETSVMHEIGHAIGLYHEHQRSDRNKHVKVSSTDKANYGIEGMQYGKYDFASIMHYYFDKDMRPRYQLSHPELVGKLKYLSQGDIDAASYLYKKSRDNNVPVNNSRVSSLSTSSMKLFSNTQQPPMWKQLRVEANKFYKKGDYNKAFSFYSSLLNEYGSVMDNIVTSNVYTKLGECCYHQDENKEAITFFSKALEFNAQNKTASNYYEELNPSSCEKGCRII